MPKSEPFVFGERVRLMQGNMMQGNMMRNRWRSERSGSREPRSERSRVTQILEVLKRIPKVRIAGGGF